jgi:hypothetical protein
MLNAATLRPGLLVSLSTSVRGNVSYRTQTIEGEHRTVDGAQQARWETERTIADPAEHEAALKARARIRTIISAVCAKSAFGLLCPEADSAELEAAIREAREIAERFNAAAALTRVSVYVMCGRIAADDVEAVKAINAEIRDLMRDMAEGVNTLDVKRIRDAADRAKSVGAMVTQDAQVRIQIAIDAARSAAKAIVKAGEQAAQEVDTRAIRAIEEARTAFLDLDEARELQAPVAAQARAIDLVPELEPVTVAPVAAQKAVQIELGD